MSEVYLGLGSNLGDKEDHIRKAITLIGERVGLVVRQSSLVSSEPWGFESANSFLNAVICCETSLTPRQVLQTTQQIERELGRRTKSSGGIYHDRPIDIDLLMYDDLQLSTPRLTLPHPHMHERDFVMIPLREILPTAVE